MPPSLPGRSDQEDLPEQRNDHKVTKKTTTKKIEKKTKNRPQKILKKKPAEMDAENFENIEPKKNSLRSTHLAHPLVLGVQFGGP